MLEIAKSLTPYSNSAFELYLKYLEFVLCVCNDISRDFEFETFAWWMVDGGRVCSETKWKFIFF